MGISWLGSEHKLRPCLCHALKLRSSLQVLHNIICVRNLEPGRATDKFGQYERNEESHSARHDSKCSPRSTKMRIPMSISKEAFLSCTHPQALSKLPIQRKFKRELGLKETLHSIATLRNICGGNISARICMNSGKNVYMSTTCHP